MSNEVNNDGIVGYECKAAFYTRANSFNSETGKTDDVVLVKRNVHHEDGSMTPEVKFMLNYERDFYILNEAHRTYEEKKAWEDVNKCRKFKSTQAELPNNVARALGRVPGKLSKSILFRNPAVYGADITTSALIKKAYSQKWPDLMSESTVAVMDTETDVINGNGENLISGSVCFKDTVLLAATKEFMGSTVDVEKKIQAAYKKYIGGIAEDLANLIATGNLKKRRKEILERAHEMLESKVKLNVEFQVFDTAGQVVSWLMKRTHELKPDFLAFWNMGFDIPVLLRALENDRIDPADVFCDPNLPPRFRRFNWRKGQAIKTTATGKSMPKHPAELWHVVDAAASFYCIDAMCVFKQVRVTEGNRNSYSLDAILSDELDLGKLRFKEADQYSGLDWHIFMQRNFKIEYLIYNIFDCMSIEILDDKTKDLALTVPTLCGHSDYSKFPSTPRRLCDDMHFFLLERGKVISTTSDDMTEELDKHVVNMNNWIVTLPSHLVDMNGLQIIEENQFTHSLLRSHVADLDVASSYPNTGSFMNMSMETTERELVQVGQIPETTKRLAGLSLTAATTNAVECSRTFFDFPTLENIRQAYRGQQAM